MHFYDTALDILFDAISYHGFSHDRLEDAVLEVLSHRSDYINDEEMVTWMSQELVHVKYDHASDGSLCVGGCTPLDEVRLTSLDASCDVLMRDLLLDDGKPLVILAGSWS